MEKKDWVSKRTKILSRMLDNPDKDGIYQTSRFYKEIDEAVLQEIDRANLELLKKIINKEGSDEESRLVILAQEFVRLTKLNNKDK